MHAHSMETVNPPNQICLLEAISRDSMVRVDEAATEVHLLLKFSLVKAG